MYFLKPVNILAVTRFRLYVAASLATSWGCFFAFFYVPMWAFFVVAAVHLISLILAVNQGYKLLVFLFLSKEGEGVDARRVQNDAPAPPPN